MDRKPADQNASHVQSVDRALILLDYLASEDREIGLTEIARALGWPKTTTHGLISTLRNRHYVDQSPKTGRYRLGVRLFELGNIVARSWDIRAVARPAMQDLSLHLGEMVQLACESDGEVLYIEKIDSTQMMRIVSEIGARLPMHCTGLGKVLLAYKHASEVEWIISKHGQRAMTSHTITSAKALEKELAKIRRQGYAIDDREIMESLRCVAAPIFDQGGEVQYALSVSALADSLTGERLDTACEMLLRTAQSVSYQIGYRQS